jgi:hypothetical protein
MIRHFGKNIPFWSMLQYFCGSEKIHCMKEGDDAGGDGYQLRVQVGVFCR